MSALQYTLSVSLICYSEMANLSREMLGAQKRLRLMVLSFFDDDLRCDNNTLVAYDDLYNTLGFVYYGGPFRYRSTRKKPVNGYEILPCSVTRSLMRQVEHMLFDKPVSSWRLITQLARQN